MAKRKSIKGQTTIYKAYTFVHKTKDGVTRTPLKPGELRCFGRVSSSSTSNSRRVDIVTNPVISHELGNDRQVFTTSGTYLCNNRSQNF